MREVPSRLGRQQWATSWERRYRKIGTAAILFVGGVPAVAQQPAASLVLDGVTVVDVERGQLLPDQRVVVTGNRIQALGAAKSVQAPSGAQIVEAKGKYLIPGLWDMHVHGPLAADAAGYPVPYTAYSVLLTNGVTGIRDASTGIPLDTLIRWRKETLAGTRIGPPRQLFSAQGVSNEIPNCERGNRDGELQTCVHGDTADQRHLVDSLKAAGADMIKLREIDKAEVYFVMALEAKKIGLPVGGQASMMTAAEASDSGATIIDHMDQYIEPSLKSLCDATRPSASVQQCKPLADLFRRNGTWLLPTARKQLGDEDSPGRVIAHYFVDHGFTFDSLRAGGWLRRTGRSPDSLGAMHIMQRVGMPIVPGTDWRGAPLGQGELHLELAIFVAEGMTPLAALQSATLNPAKMLKATDSLGTVAVGKLADLVLLDANPLEDITNTATVRAVIANGRYFDRNALDQLAAAAETKAKGTPWSAD